MPLPPPAPNQAYCTLSVLLTGHITLPLDWVLASHPGTTSTVPVFAFALRRVCPSSSSHSSQQNEKEKEEKENGAPSSSSPSGLLLVDLGTRRDWHALPPSAVSWIDSTFGIVSGRDVLDALAGHESEVSHILITHAHFDHFGDTSLFPSATFLVSKDTASLVAAGYPVDPKSLVPADLLPPERTTVLEGEWREVGPFPRALDLHGDGSVYIIDAPGHVPGHINVLLRTSADGAWALLAADSCHDWRVLSGEDRIAREGRYGCAHGDVQAAERHLGRVREVMREERVRVMLAHDLPWWEENRERDVFWPNTLASL